MPVIPFAIQWTIPEDRLAKIKNSYSKCLYSTEVANASHFEYYLSVCPNGDDENRRGQTWIFFYLEFKNVDKVEADCIFTFETANISEQHHYDYVKSIGSGIRICNTEDFFNPEKKFIVDKKFTVKVDGTFKYETKNDSNSIVNLKKQYWENCRLGNELWGSNETKDFTIITSKGGKIKVHKFVFENRRCCLPFYAKMKETNEDKMEITDFSYPIVETAMKMLYDCKCATYLTKDELMSLLKFFDTFELPFFKEKVEKVLMLHISVLNVCRLTNFSVSLNSETLKSKCMEFLMNCIKSKTFFRNFEILDKDVAFTIFQNYVGVIVDVNNVPTNLQQQKWEGGDLGNKLWENDEKKDFTIVVSDDDKEIKIHKLPVETRSQFFAGLFNSASGNSVEISEFLFSVVETAFKIIYDCNFVSSLCVEELMKLLQFFDKYNLPDLKDKVEPHLIELVSATTVCSMTKCSILTNSEKLKNKCMEFLTESVKSKIALSDIESLDKNIVFNILQNHVSSFFVNV